MGQLRSTFRAYAWLFSSPAEILESMQQAMPDHAMATMVCLTVDTSTWELRYASAGHLPLLLLDRATDAVTLLDANGPPLLGVEPGQTYRDAHVTLTPETTLVAYTDGLVERRTASIDSGIDRLAASLRAGAALDADALAGRLLAELDDVPGAEDDVALLVLRCAAPEDGRRA
jgi:serine phosphatase RsbU (regulator of sigma subunit)